MKQIKTTMYITVVAIVIGVFAGVLQANPKPVKKEPVKVTKQTKQDAKPAAEPVKKEHKKKPTLKKKYADKK